MKLSRRQLVSVAAGSLAGTAAAQTASPPAATDLNQQARESNKRISDTLSKFEIPVATEPAFQFKP